MALNAYSFFSFMMLKVFKSVSVSIILGSQVYMSLMLRSFSAR